MDTIIKAEQGIKMIGEYTITKSFIESEQQKDLLKEIERRRDINLPYIDLVRMLNVWCKKDIFVVKNIIPTVGRAMIADNLSNVSPTNAMKIEYSALGTGITSPSNSDTQLATETYRRQVASISSLNHIVYVTAFYSATEVNGTFYEHALFSDATGAVNDGVLFSRVLLEAPTGIPKSLSETLTIDYTLTIS